MKLIPWALTFSLSVTSFARFDKSKFYSEMNGHSDQVKMLVGEELKYSYSQDIVDQVLFDGETSALSSSQDNGFDILGVFSSNDEEKAKPVKKNYKEFLASYNKYNNRLESYSNANISQDLNRAVKGGIVVLAAGAGAAMTVGSGGLLAPVAIGMAGYVATELSDEYYNGVQEATKGEMIEQLGSFLKSSVDEEGRELLKDLTPENLRELDEKFGLQDQLNNLEVCENCDPKKEAHLRNAMVKNLTNIVKGNTHDIAKLKKSINKLGDDVETNRNNIKVIGTRLDQYGKKLSSFGETLVSIQNQMGENQKYIKNKLQNMSNKISDNTRKISENAQMIGDNKEQILENQKDIKFVKDFMYSKMSPSQKLLALKSGAYGKTMLKEKKELLMKQLSFQANVGDFLNGARQVSQIASNLGINLGKFDQAIGIGTSAFNAASKLMSPNPDFLGAAVAITGIFAKRQDVGALRHKQIMEALGVINKKLDAVLENQIEILKGQEKILKGLDQISKQIQDSTVALYDHIELVRLDVKDNKRGIKEGLKRPVTACNSFIHSLKKALAIHLDKSPLEIRARHFNARQKMFNTCSEISEILSTYKQESEFSVLFSKVYEDLDRDDARNKYVKEYYQPLVSYLLELLEDDSDFKNYFSLGLVTINDPVSLKGYVKALEDDDHANSVLSAEKWQGYDSTLNLKKLLMNPLSTKSVVEAARIMNQMFTYFDLTASGKFPRNVVELIDKPGSADLSLGYEYLQHVDVLLETALVQTSLLNGQLLIPLMYENLLKGEKLDVIGKILAKSEFIKDNFLTYLVVNRMYEQTNTRSYTILRRSSAYERALSVNKDFLVEHALGIGEIEHLKVSCTDKCMLNVSKKNEADFSIELNSLKKRVHLNTIALHPEVKELMGWSQITKENMLGYLYEDSIRNDDNLENSAAQAMHYRTMIYNSSKLYRKKK